MAVKHVTTKEQIPKWYTKRISNFKNLTTNEAIFEYEAIKVRERQRKFAKKAGIKDYIAPKIVRPEAVIESDIKYIQNIKPERIKESVVKKERAVKITSPIYDYDKYNHLEEKFEPEEVQQRYDWDRQDEYDYWDDGGYVDEDYIPEPEPVPSYEPEPQEPLFVDLSTGEAIYEEDLPDYMNRTRELIDDIIYEAQQDGDKTIISYSAYKSGRTRNARSRAWVADNVNRAVGKVVSMLEGIKNDEGRLRAFAERASNPDYLSQLQNAIGDYINQAYADTTGQSFLVSEVFNLLSFTPMSLEDSMEFEYEE